MFNLLLATLYSQSTNSVARHAPLKVGFVISLRVLYYITTTIVVNVYIGVLSKISRRGSLSNIILLNVIGKCLLRLNLNLFSPLVILVCRSKKRFVSCKKASLNYLTYNLTYLFRINKYVKLELNPLLITKNIKKKRA